MCRPSVQVRKSIYHTKRLRKSNRGGSFFQDRSKQWKDSTQRMYIILQSDFVSCHFIEVFLLVINSLLSRKPCELTSSVSKLFKSRPGHAIPVITIDSPPSCSLVQRVHYTELDVTQIRARVRPHTALLLSYLCKAPLRGGSIAEVWSFISSV